MTAVVTMVGKDKTIFITVQQKVEEAISALMKKPVAVRGASRTDTGVHAMCQGVVF